MKQWLDVVGIGEDGLEGLSSAARSAVENAQVIIGGDRHHNLAPHNHSAERVRWPSPFSKMTQEVSAHRGRRTVLLVTGDPLWYSAGARVARMLPMDEVCFYPQISAFQLACARMGWSLAGYRNPDSARSPCRADHSLFSAEFPPRCSDRRKRCSQRNRQSALPSRVCS